MLEKPRNTAAPALWDAGSVSRSIGHGLLALDSRKHPRKHLIAWLLRYGRHQPCNLWRRWLRSFRIEHLAISEQRVHNSLNRCLAHVATVRLEEIPGSLRACYDFIRRKIG